MNSNTASNGDDNARTCYHGTPWRSTKVWNEACFKCRAIEDAFDTQTRRIGGLATQRARESDQKYAPQYVWIRDGGVAWPEAVGTSRRFAGSQIQWKGGGGPEARRVRRQSSRRATWGVQRSIVKAREKDWEREWEVVRFLREDAPKRLRNDRRIFSDPEWLALSARWPSGPRERTSDDVCANALGIHKSTFQENYARAFTRAVRARDYVQKAMPAQLGYSLGNSPAPHPYLQELLEEFSPDETTEQKRELERDRKAKRRAARRRCGVAMRGRVTCSRPPAHQGQHRSSR
jgi:hypothetical protein